MSLTILRILAAAAAGALLVACGGEDAGDPPVPSAEPAAEEQQTLNEGGARLVEKKSADGKAMRLFGTSSDGVQYEASIGEFASIPESFPSDIPVLPNAQPMAALSAGKQGIIVTFKSSEEQSKIQSFYATELSKSGWTIQSENSFNAQLMIEASKGTRKVVVTIAGTSGDSRLSIVVSGEN